MCANGFLSGAGFTMRYLLSHDGEITGKCTGKRLLGKPKHRWEGNLRVYLKEKVSM